MIRAPRDQLAALGKGAGPDVDGLVDLNFHFKTEGFLRAARALESFDLLWVEIDTRDPRALHYVRSRTTLPVASCESLCGRRDDRPFLEQQSVDVAIVDVPWNGPAESLTIAAMADTDEVNAVVPDPRIMEIDPDTVPWYDDLVTVKPRIQDGHLLLPTGPGWGTEVNEEAVRAHPPRTR